MNNLLEILYNKISICYSDSVYLDYEKLRYGVNNCKESLDDLELDRYEDYMNILKVLLLDYCDNNTYKPYKEQNIFRDIYQSEKAEIFSDNKNRFFRNPIYGKSDCKDCDMNKIINHIKSL